MEDVQQPCSNTSQHHCRIYYTVDGAVCVPLQGARMLGLQRRRRDVVLTPARRPSDYRKLLNQCFVVVSDNAPPLSAFYPDRRWSQREIVKRIIEMIISDLPSPSNVLCSDYDKHCCSSSAVELLTSSAWSFLLGRVGDGVMVYLLKYTSIFLPLPRKKHYQVAGFPISDFCFKSKHISEPKYRRSSLALGLGRKRKRVYEVDLLSEKEYSNGVFGDDVPSGSVNCFDGLSYSSSFTRHCWKKCNQKSISGEPTLRTRTANCNNEGNPNEEHHGSSNQLIVKPRKRQRQLSWQRHRKRRQFDIQETHSLIQCARNASDRDSSYEKPQSGFNTSKQTARALKWHLQIDHRRKILAFEVGIGGKFRSSF